MEPETQVIAEAAFQAIYTMDQFTNLSWEDQNHVMLIIGSKCLDWIKTGGKA